MRFTCPLATLEDKRVLKQYLGNAASIVIWPDNTLTITTRRLARPQLEAIGSVLDMLGLEIFLKPTAEGEDSLLPT